MSDESTIAATRLQLILDYHRDCCSEMRACVRVRNRLFVVALAVLVGLTFRSWDAASGDLILALLFDRIAGIQAEVDRSVLSVILWASLLFVTGRYFQAAMQVERHYAHLHRVEGEMSTVYGSDLLSRESTGYLTNYPLFLDWMQVLYTWVFPIALLAVAIWSIGVEIHLGGLAFSTVVPGAVGTATIVSTALYVYSSKFEPKRRRRREPAQERGEPGSPAAKGSVPSRARKA